MDIDRIKQRLGSCYDVLQKYGHPHKTGNYICPFHEEKLPSFSVYEAGEKFKCHACGVNGDVIALYALFEKIDNTEAVKRLSGHENPQELKVQYKKFQAEKDYITSRSIDYEAVKEIVSFDEGFVIVPIRDGNGKKVGAQSRSIHEKKFKISAGGNSGIFWENLKIGNSDLFIVEGVFDFLTIRQCTPHILGYVSASSYRTNVSNIIGKYRNIYWLGDQDEAGEKLRTEFLKLYPDLTIYGLPRMAEKTDVNDLFRGIKKDEIVPTLKEICLIIQEGKITKTKDHIHEVLTALRNTEGVPFTWGTRARDEELGILDRGQYNVLVGETGSGKTEFSFYLARENAKRGHKILYLSLEMTTHSLLRRYASKKAMITRGERLDGNIPEHKISRAKKVLSEIPDNVEFFGGEGVTIEEIGKKITEREYDMIFIDNFGFIEDEATEDKLEKISRELVNLKKKNETCIIALHHFRKGKEKIARNIQDLRGTGKIGDDIDLGIQYLRAEKQETDEEKCACLIRILKDRDEGALSSFKMFFQAGTFHDFYTAKL